MKRSTTFLALALTLLLGFIAAGCQRNSGTVLGRKPKGTQATILAVRAGDVPTEVVLSGEMIEKCPVAGCWFRLRDRTGTIKVDTKAAGFVVVKVPLGSRMSVAGKIATEGDEVVIQASGVRY